MEISIDTQAMLAFMAAMFIILYYGLPVFQYFRDWCNAIRWSEWSFDRDEIKYILIDRILSFESMEKLFVNVAVVNKFPNVHEQTVKHVNGVIHCSTGPVIVGNNMSCWVRFGKLHRDHGPALIWGDLIRFYRNGELIDEKGVFER